MHSTVTLSVRALAIIVVLSFVMCGASPPVHDGHSVRAGLGYGQYRYVRGGCDTPHTINDVHEVRLHARWEHFWKGIGVNAVVEAFFDWFVPYRVQIDYGTETVEQTDFNRRLRMSLPLVAMRVGYHHDYFGAELGLLMYAYLPFVSATAWIGHRSVHAWASFNAEPARYRQVLPHPTWPVSVGIGHATENVRARLGMMLDGGTLELHARVLEATWFGARASYYDQRNWSTLLYVTREFGE